LEQELELMKSDAARELALQRRRQEVRLEEEKLKIEREAMAKSDEVGREREWARERAALAMQATHYKELFEKIVASWEALAPLRVGDAHAALRPAAMNARNETVAGGVGGGGSGPPSATNAVARGQEEEGPEGHRRGEEERGERRAESAGSERVKERRGEARVGLGRSKGREASEEPRRERGVSLSPPPRPRR